MPSSQRAGAGRVSTFFFPRGKRGGLWGGAEDRSFLRGPPYTPDLADTPESTGTREEGPGSHQDFFPKLSCLSLPQGGLQPSAEKAGVCEVMVQVMSEDLLALGLGAPGPCSSLPQLPPHLPFSIQEGYLLLFFFFFYHLLHYYFITFQVTGSRIDFVSILAGGTWCALVIV